MRLRIASRQSDLARIQSHEVAKALKNAHPGLEVEFHFSESLGDKNLVDPLWKMPGKGVFTEDLTSDLIHGKADLIVHSWKDLPVEERAETQITATLQRADARDLLLFKKKSREKLESSAGMIQIFSSSPRREYNLRPFLKEYLPGQPASVEFVSVRGNIPTRLRKLLESQDIDGLIVAKAAIDRLLATTADEFEAARKQVRVALTDCDWMVLPLSANPSAAAQGALAVEIRRDRDDVRQLLKAIHHEKTFVEASSERKILKTYGGGCHQKIGVTVLARDLDEKSKGLRLLFLKGLTDNGETLNKAGGESAPADSVSVLRSNWLFERKNRSEAQIPSDVDALFVSQAAAAPENLEWTGILWTAGLSTWKKMAASGYWVHGSSEGLGEAEDPRIEAFATNLRWGTLTHSQSAEPPRGEKIITYDLVPKVDVAAPPAGRLHWTSASLFDEAVRRWPELRNRSHSCGPGKTLEHLRTQVKDLTVRWLGDEGKK